MTKPGKEKLKVGWIIGLIAVAIGLLIIGRLTSETIRETDRIPDSEQVGVDDIQINGGQGTPIELYTDEVESATGSNIPSNEN